MNNQELPSIWKSLNQGLTVNTFFIAQRRTGWKWLQAFEPRAKTRSSTDLDSLVVVLLGRMQHGAAVDLGAAQQAAAATQTSRAGLSPELAASIAAATTLNKQEERVLERRH